MSRRRLDLSADLAGRAERIAEGHALADATIAENDAAALRRELDALRQTHAGDLARERERVTAAEAARDAAEAQRAALAGAVRVVGNLIAEHGCSCDCDCAHTTGEHTSACDPCLACRASDVVSPLLLTAPAPAPAVVRADVARAYLDAQELPGPAALTDRYGECLAAANAARDALLAALAAAGAP